MSTTKWLDAFALCLAAVAVVVVGFKNYQGDNSRRLLNVSYDPTREVYQEINSRFILKYEAEVGHRVSIEQSHGGSSILGNVQFHKWLPTERIYTEKDEAYSATLNAVRDAYRLLAEENKGEQKDAAYYLV